MSQEQVQQPPGDARDRARPSPPGRPGRAGVWAKDQQAAPASARQHSPAWPPALAGFGRVLARYPALRFAAVVLAAAMGQHLVRTLLSPSIFFNAGWVVYWPCNAILIALLLMVPRSYWLPILLGVALNQAQSEWADEHIFEMACDALANLIEVLIPAFCLPPFRSLPEWMSQRRLISRFILFALVLSPVLSSIPASLAQSLVHHKSFWPQAMRWSAADGLGTALWLPLVLALRSRETYDLFRPRALPRTVALVGLTCAASWLVFYKDPLPFPFIIMPTLLLVVFQLGFSGAVLAVNLMTIIVSAATLHGYGPFWHLSAAHPEYGIQMLQLFLTLCMLMSLPISVLLLQRRHFQLQLEDAYLRMEAVASQDGLTGLANRRRFDATLETEWRRARRHNEPLTLLMIDVDHFKSYNDTYGHVAGDQCLRAVAAALTSIPLRAGDLVARYGGEEFVILLPGDDAAGALHIAEITRQAIEQLAPPPGASPSSLVTVSIGCGAVVPTPESNPALLVENADRALYQAKQQGRNCVQLFTEQRP